jgi:hypothetical protein
VGDDLSNLLTDAEISSLLAESKILPPDYLSRVSLKAKRGHKERELDLVGGNGSEFRLVLRQSLHNVLDFSVILAFCPAGSSQVFRLRRYNGKSHEHTNQIEKHTFYDFHIHMATERYQSSGLREDAFAIPTNRYADFHGGLSCLLTDCSFEVPPSDTLSLF